MVFAVARATARKAANAITHHGGHNGPGQAARQQFHTGAQIRHSSTAASSSHGLGPCPPKPARSPPHRLFSHSRNALSRLFNHLTAPGLRVPTHIRSGGAEAIRSLHSGAAPTIKSKLSLHARTALSSGPRNNVFLPRPPSPGVRVATNVGLGTARNFSTARPIFQNLVDNVPVVGRAFYEADLDLRKKSLLKQARPRRSKRSSTLKGKEMLKPADPVIKQAPQTEVEEDWAHYFRSTVAPITTYLFVPLAPTPSSRVPLPSDPIFLGNFPNLLPPLSTFESFHASYETRAARASSLFSRLEQADVWSRGAKCSAYGQGSEGAGLCTVLKVEFVGWTEAEVRSVIGESGTGWCALEEVRFDDMDGMSDLSSVIDPSETELTAMKSPGYVESSSSFIMPMLDLSSTFLESAAPPSPSLMSVSSSMASRPLSPIPDDIFAAAMETEYDDPWADQRHSEDPSPSVSVVSPASENGWCDSASERSWQSLGALEFSSQHWSRRMDA